MEDKSYCNCCVNKGTDKCSNCYREDSRGWRHHIEFRPTKEVSKYFSYLGNDEYMWNSISREAPPVTKSVNIHNRNYCPYCANQMFPIQDPDTLEVIGYTCFCDGAIAESQYEADKEAMLNKHEQELEELKNRYRPRLTTDVHTLFNIKQEQDRKSFEFFNKDARSLFGETKTFELEDLII